MAKSAHKGIRDQIFISYSHDDAKWLKLLQDHLQPYIRKDRLRVWDDTKIFAGDKWQEEIDDALASAKVAVLLVTHSFLASDFIINHELPILLKAAENQGLKIIWIAVSSSAYDMTEIAGHQAANDPSTPLNGLSEADLHKELVKICDKIEIAYKYLTNSLPAPISLLRKADTPPPSRPKLDHQSPHNNIVLSIKHKLESEYNPPILGSKEKAYTYSLLIRNRMLGVFEGVHLRSSEEIIKNCTISYNLVKFIDSMSFIGEQSKVDHDNLRNYARLNNTNSYRVSAACNSPSAVAALLIMTKWAVNNDYIIDINYEAPAGKIQVLQAYRSLNPYHVIIVGSPAFSFSQYSKLDENDRFIYRSENSEFVFCLPVHEEQQYLLVPKKSVSNRLRRIYAPERSATEEPHRTGKFKELASSGRVSTLQSNYELVLEDLVKFLRHEIPVEKGAGLTIWSPASDAICEKQNLIPAPGFSYSHLIGMFLLKSLVQSSPQVAVSFCNLFVAAWNHCRIHKQEALRLLMADSDYSERFAYSSGRIQTISDSGRSI